jgi:WD40 repeat protein
VLCDFTAMRKEVLDAEKRQVFGLAFSSDGHTLASAQEDRIILYDVAREARRIKELQYHVFNDDVRSLAFSPSGKFLLAGYMHGWHLWETATGALLARGEFRAARKASVSFLPTGDSVFAVNDGVLGVPIFEIIPGR